MSYEMGLRLLSAHSALTEPTEISLLGRHWDLLPDVFDPAADFSTALFTARLPYPEGGRMLEIGCGAGVTSVIAALRGCASVTAVDISQAAVANTQLNVRRHSVQDRVCVLRGDLFEPVADRKFDLVYWNSSFIEPPADHVATGELNLAVFDPGYKAHQRFLDQAAAHLHVDGKLMLGFSNLGNRALLNAHAERAGLAVMQAAAGTVRQGGTATGIEYQLLELKPMCFGGLVRNES